MNLTPWNEIENDYADALLLGNGASITVAESLHYNSLYEAARDEGFLTASVTAIFEYFDTTDFEFVLRMVANAHMVNDHLGVDEVVTEATYNLIKSALIETVRQIHPEHDEITGSLTPISNFLSRFDTVYSLNYDLIVYWAMMHGNATAGGNRFKDCFVGEAFNENYDFYDNPMAILSRRPWYFILTETWLLFQIFTAPKPKSKLALLI